MKEVTLKIPEDKYQFFMDLVRHLGFEVTQVEEDTKEEIVANLRQGFKEMKMYKEGKLQGTPLDDFLNEL